MSENTRRDFMTNTGAVAGMAALAAAFTGGQTQAAELNAMQPTPQQLQEFMKLPKDQPIVMVNLLKFKEGGEAEYQKYGVGVAKILNTIGADILFSGQCKMAMIGGVSWDAVALVRYPNSMALVNMAQSPEYQKIHVHRDAGLEGQINLAVVENSLGGGSDAQGVTAEQVMGQLDANGDGKIELSEAPEQLQGAFSMVDLNADGGIDLEEAQMIADFMNGQ